MLTEPNFLARRNGEAKIGVNLRWYLANSWYRAAMKDGVRPDRVVFLSIHADSRHAGLRGVMVYVPGADYRTRTYGHQDAISRKERVRSEAVSRKLAESVVRSFRQEDLPVQPYQPVRDKVIRGSSKWVPAVLRGNEIPTKILVEMVNISNRDDAELLSRAGDRERLARALARSLHEYFGEDPANVASRIAAP